MGLGLGRGDTEHTEGNMFEWIVSGLTPVEACCAGLEALGSGAM